MNDPKLDVPDSFEDAERFKRLFVDPAVDALGQRMELHLKPLVTGVADHDKRLAELEKSQKKALVGYGVFAAGLSVVLASGLDWFKKRIGW